MNANEIVWSASPAALLATEIVLKATLVLALAGLAATIARRRSAAVRHFSWTVGIAGALAMPVLVLVPASLSPKLSLDLPVPPAARGAAPLAGLVSRPGFAPTELDRLSAHGVHEGLVESGHDAGASMASARPGSAGFLSALRALGFALEAVPFAVAAWGLGALTLLGFLATGIARAQGLARRGTPLELDELSRLCSRMGIGRTPRLVKSPRVAVPMTCGVLRPQLVVPVGFASWSRERREIAILHELAHVQRFDFLTQTMGRATAALYWFHPLAWIASRRLRREAEHAADDRVLSSGPRASDYAEHLLGIVQDLGPDRRDATMATSMAGTPIEDRLVAILDPQSSRRKLSRKALLMLSIPTALFIALLGSLQVSATVPEAPPLLVDSMPATTPLPPTAPAPAFAASPKSLPPHVLAALPAPEALASRGPIATEPVAPSAPKPVFVLAGNDEHSKKRRRSIGERVHEYFEGWHEDRGHHASSRLMGKALDWHQEGEHEKAIEGWTEVRDSGHREEVCAYNIACAHARLGNTDEAIRWLQVSIDEGFDAAKYLETDDDLFSLRSDRRFQRIREDQRRLVRERIAAGETDQRDLHGEALEAFRELQAEGSDDGSAWYSVGYDLHELGEHDQALVAWRRALELEHSVSDTSYNIACALARQGKSRQALSALEDAVERGYTGAAHMMKDDDLASIRTEPRFVEVAKSAKLLQLPATSLADQARKDELAPEWQAASRRYQDYLEDHPRSGHAWFKLGFASLQLDDAALAEEAFEKSFRFGYSKMLSSYNLACSKARAGSTAEAFDWLTEAVEFGFRDPHHLRHDGDLESLRGDPRFDALLEHVDEMREERKREKDLVRAEKRYEKAQRDLERARENKSKGSRQY